MQATADDFIALSAAGRLADRSVPRPPSSQPGPGAHPAQASSSFDDSAWAVVDAPHDMLINQKFDGGNSKGMAYLQRNSG